MDIQSRKLMFIEEFLRVSDEDLITKLELIIHQEKNIANHKDLKPFSNDEFQEIIKQAKHESETGQVISHQDLMKKVSEWR